MSLLQKTTPPPPAHHHPEQFHPYLFFSSFMEMQFCSQSGSFIPAFVTNLAVQLLANTDTWIIPQNMATPAAPLQFYLFTRTLAIKEVGMDLSLLTPGSFPLQHPNSFASSQPHDHISSVSWACRFALYNIISYI